MIIATTVTILFTIFGLTVRKDRKEYLDWFNSKS